MYCIMWKLVNNIHYILLQLIISTIPEEGQTKSPNILTEDSIKLLFEIQKKVKPS